MSLGTTLMSRLDVTTGSTEVKARFPLPELTARVNGPS